jgi:hypothetical protein
MTIDRLRASLADRYRLERELGQGGMRRRPAEAGARLKSLKRPLAPGLAATGLCCQRSTRHFSDASRAVASATRSRRDRDEGGDRA